MGVEAGERTQEVGGSRTISDLLAWVQQGPYCTVKLSKVSVPMFKWHSAVDSCIGTAGWDDVLASAGLESKYVIDI